MTILLPVVPSVRQSNKTQISEATHTHSIPEAIHLAFWSSDTTKLFMSIQYLIKVSSTEPRCHTLGTKELHQLPTPMPSLPSCFTIESSEAPKLCIRSLVNNHHINMKLVITLQLDTNLMRPEESKPSPPAESANTYPIRKAEISFQTIHQIIKQACLRKKHQSRAM
jgi:hypothetical protein